MNKKNVLFFVFLLIFQGSIAQVTQAAQPLINETLFNTSVAKINMLVTKLRDDRLTGIARQKIWGQLETEMRALENLARDFLQAKQKKILHQLRHKILNLKNKDESIHVTAILTPLSETLKVINEKISEMKKNAHSLKKVARPKNQTIRTADHQRIIANTIHNIHQELENKIKYIHMMIQKGEAHKPKSDSFNRLYTPRLEKMLKTLEKANKKIADILSEARQNPFFDEFEKGHS